VAKNGITGSSVLLRFFCRLYTGKLNGLPKPIGPIRRLCSPIGVQVYLPAFDGNELYCLVSEETSARNLPKIFS